MTPQGLPGLVVSDVNAELQTGQRIRMKRARAAGRRLGQAQAGNGVGCRRRVSGGVSGGPALAVGLLLSCLVFG